MQIKMDLLAMHVILNGLKCNLCFNIQHFLYFSMDKLSQMGLKSDQCQLHGDYNYNPSLCPLIDESNIFEVHISVVI